MTLEERVQNARKELFQRYDRLNALWLKAEEQLTQLHVPRPVECVYRIYESDDCPDPNYEVIDLLGLQKIKGKWRICYGEKVSSSNSSSSNWTPIVDCSAEIRVEAAKHLPKLRKAVVESAEQFIPNVDSAIQQLSEHLGQHAELANLLAERSKRNGQAK